MLSNTRKKKNNNNNNNNNNKITFSQTPRSLLSDKLPSKSFEKEVINVSLAFPSSSSSLDLKGKKQAKFSKVIVDEDLFVEQAVQQACLRCNQRKWKHQWHTYAQGVSPILKLQCKGCKNRIILSTSRKWTPPSGLVKKLSKLNYNTALLFVSVLMSGLTLTPVCAKTYNDTTHTEHVTKKLPC